MSTEHHLTTEEILLQGYTITKWNEGMVPAITQIEKQNWAPWLAASESSLLGRVQYCPRMAASHT